MTTHSERKRLFAGWLLEAIFLSFLVFGTPGTPERLVKSDETRQTFTAQDLLDVSSFRNEGRSENVQTQGFKVGNFPVAVSMNAPVLLRSDAPSFKELNGVTCRFFIHTIYVFVSAKAP